MPITISGAGIIGGGGGVSLASDPATGDRSNLIATMKKFTDEFPNLAGSSGWQKLPSGLVIQWGWAMGQETQQTFNLPVSFSTTFLSLVVSTGKNVNQPVPFVISADIASKSSFIVAYYNAGTGAVGAGHRFYYTAIGV